MALTAVSDASLTEGLSQPIVQQRGEIGADDEVHLCEIEVRDVRATMDDVVLRMLVLLRRAGVPLLDLRSTGATHIGAGLKSGSFTVVSYARMPAGTITAMREALSELDPRPQASCRIESTFSYRAVDVRFRVSLQDEPCGHSACGCPLHDTCEYPLVGMHRGEYLDLRKVGGRFLCMEGYASSWNYKSDGALASAKRLTSHRIRTADLVVTEVGGTTSIWCLGFGWQ